MTVSLEAVLEPGDVGRLCQAGEVARDLGMRLFVVGGCVRDILMGRPHVDWDLVVEGGLAADLAAALADAWGGQTVCHERFLTATVTSLDGPPCDIATARTESYTHPGALPTVAPAAMVDDLWRRDFSINAMALALSPDDWGQVLDPTGGRADLAAGLVRVLHERSFLDDATRIVRAIGFEQRLSFGLEPATERWLRAAIAGEALPTLSAERLGAAIATVLRGPAGPAAIRRADELGVVAALSAGRRLGERSVKALGDVSAALRELQEGDIPEHRMQASLAALLVGGGWSAEGLAECLRLERVTASALAGAETWLRRYPSGFAAPAGDGALWEALDGAGFAAVASLWLAATDEAARMALAHYWLDLRGTRADFDASRLHEPAAAGPAIGEALRAAIRAKLDYDADAKQQFAVACRALQDPDRLTRGPHATD